MRIMLIDWGTLNGLNGSFHNYTDDAEIGLHYISLSKTHYDVIDKQLFMLAVIKYGIKFEEIKC